jgi:hypothetical protein
MLRVDIQQSKSFEAARHGRRLAIALAVTAGFALSFSSAALADDCNADIGKFSQKRQAIINDLNAAAKANKTGQLDPTSSCGKLRELAAVEQQLLAYMNKNKSWCSIPDDVVNNFSSASEKSKVIAGKACAAAEQIKKGLQTQAAQAPKLPTGPL